MLVQIKKLYEDAKLPLRANPNDAGADFYAHSKEVDFELGQVTFGTGVAIMIPEGYVGLLFPRSSVYKYEERLANCVGVLDSGYQEEIFFKYDMSSLNPWFDRSANITYSMNYAIGDRIGQIVIVPIADVQWDEVNEFSETSNRGGFGSTGN